MPRKKKKTIDIIIAEETQKIHALDHKGIEEYFAKPTGLTFHIDTALNYRGVHITVVRGDASVTIDTYFSLVIVVLDNDIRIAPLLQPTCNLISEIYAEVCSYFQKQDHYVTLQGGCFDEF